MINVVVFISGRGSNLEALLKDQNGYCIKHVISNKNNIKGLTIAKNNGVNHSYLNWSDKNRAEKHAAEIIDTEETDLIVLAGFMKILTNHFVNKYENKIINIHPSLLPEYPGLDTHQRVLDDNKELHGASVHYVDALLDHGKVISQTTIPVENSDTANSLAEKLITKEHKLLTHTVGLIANKEVYWSNNNLYYHQNLIENPLLVQ